MGTLSLGRGLHPRTRNYFSIKTHTLCVTNLIQGGRGPRESIEASERHMCCNTAQAVGNGFPLLSVSLETPAAVIMQS